jgi:hypothetical protein
MRLLSTNRVSNVDGSAMMVGMKHREDLPEIPFPPDFLER